MQRSQRDPGEVLRRARVARGWTQARLGRLCGYSASKISRWETGDVPLRDVDVMRALAGHLGMSPTAFGLADTAGGKTGSANGSSTRLWRVAPDAEEDPVDRRAFLAAAGAVGTGLAFPHSAQAADSALDPAAVLERRLSTVLIDGTPTGPAVTRSVLQAGLTAATSDFECCQYEALADRLPALIASAENTHSEHPAPAVAALVSQTYQLAARVLGKLEVGGLQPIAADRASHAAATSDDPVILAAARGAVATAARRTGYHGAGHALRVSLDAAQTLLDNHASAPSAALREAGMLYCGAGYAAAVRGDRQRSVDAYREAVGIARRIAVDQDRERVLAHVISHQISAAHRLGDAATALEYARGVRVDALPTRERKARVLVDIAQSWSMYGQPVKAYKALLAAERVVPSEVHTRGAARRLVGDLLGSPRQAGMPGLHDLAARVHATT
ncbi:helix-turn-helix domain-containing protein [Saccharopolyspora hattusasensis]|uniref:helix-turn-helix domain-containing protein n=1 Tax=Saccharopolyspora hattusasensis TaxID=1128679 RepID=UPI003D958A40